MRRAPQSDAMMNVKGLLSNGVLCLVVSMKQLETLAGHIRDSLLREIKRQERDD